MLKPYYQDHAVTIYHGDCMKILPELPPVDTLITSPPYGVEKNSHYDYKKYLHLDLLEEEMLDAIADAHADYKWLNIQALSANKKMLFRWLGKRAAEIKETLIWTKSSTAPAMAQGCVNSAFEFIFCLTKIDAFNRTFRNQNWRGVVSNVFSCPPASFSNPAVDIHHATFPIQLPMFILENFGGKTVLDPFCGTGTVLRAAKDKGLKGVGIEINEKYCEIAAKRALQESLFRQSDEAHEFSQAELL